MPVLDTLAELVTRGRSIPVHLDYLPRLEALVAEVQAWKECAANTFLCENSPYSLLEVRGVDWRSARSVMHRQRDSMCTQEGAVNIEYICRIALGLHELF